MNSKERLENKLKYGKGFKPKAKYKKAIGRRRVDAKESGNSSGETSNLSNIVKGDMLGTGIIGGLDLNISTPF